MANLHAYHHYYFHRPGSSDPVGGVQRFQSLVNHYRSAPQYAHLPDLLTFFSGDAFNPSLESSVTKGRHMVPFLNNAGTDVACMGVCFHVFKELEERPWANQYVDHGS